MFHEPLSFALVTLFCSLTGVRIYHWISTGRETGSDSVDPHPLAKFRNPVWLVPCALLITSVVFYSVSYSTGLFGWIHEFNLPVDPLFRWSGVAVSAAGLVLLHWSHLALGRFFSLNLSFRDDHQLITSGPYRAIRHPVYAALILFFFGAAVTSANGVIIILASWFIVLFLLRIKREEQLLEQQFGDAYRSYKVTTGRLLPRLSFNTSGAGVKEEGDM